MNRKLTDASSVQDWNVAYEEASRRMLSRLRGTVATLQFA